MKVHIRQSTWAAAVLVVSIALAYGNTFTAPFIFDDTVNIVENASIRRLWPPWLPLSIPADTGLAGRPVVNFSLAVNYAISGEKVWSYHAANLLIHILAALTLLGVVRRTLNAAKQEGPDSGGALLFPFACALLWGLHPLQTQAVTYIIQRCESLMALFFLLAIYGALRGWQSPSQNRWHLAAVLFFFLAVGAKEVAAVAPLLFFAYEWVFRGRPPLQAARLSPLLYGGLALGLLAAILTAASADTLLSRTEQTPLDLSTYWLTQCRVVLHYLRLALWPSGLTIDYGWPAAAFEEAWPAVLVVLALLGLSARALWKRRPAGFLGSWFFLILAPTSLIPLPDLAFEHRMYLPLAAVVFFIAGAAGRVLASFAQPRRGAVSLGLCLGLALLLGVLTFERNRDYRSETAIWSDTIKKRPANFRGYHGLGLALSREGRLAEGLALLRRAHKLNPRNAYVNNDTGFILFLLDRPEESIPFFREAIRIKPLNPKAHNNLGAALARTGRLEEAIIHFSEALKIKPGYPEARNNLLQASAALEQRRSDRR